MRELSIIPLGIFITIIGFIIIFIGIFLAAQTQDQKGNLKVSFFGLIGPIPFGFANDKRLFIFSIMMTVFFVIIFLIMNRGIK